MNTSSRRLPVRPPSSQATPPYPKPVVALGIDKLKISIPRQVIDNASASALTVNFDDLCEQGAKRLPRSGHFERRIHVRIGGYPVHLECSPIQARMPHGFTATFNPNRYTDEQLQEVFATIRYALGFDANTLLRHATIGQIDINIDFALDLRGMLIEVAAKRFGMTVMRKLDGQVGFGSVYIGSEEASRFRMYDKRQKNLVDMLEPYADDIVAALETHTAFEKWPIQIKEIRQKTAAPPLWRMEIVNKPKKPLPILQLDEIASCFDRVRLLNLPTDVAPFDDDTGRLFVLAAGLVGIPAALQRLGDSERRKFKTALAKRPPVEWWNSKRYATLIRFALQRLKPILPVSAARRPMPAGARKLAAAEPSTIVTPPRRQSAQFAQKRVQTARQSAVKSAATVHEKARVHRIV